MTEIQVPEGTVGLTPESVEVILAVVNRVSEEQQNNLSSFGGLLTTTATHEQRIQFLDYVNRAAARTVGVGETTGFSIPLSVEGVIAAQKQGVLEQYVEEQLLTAWLGLFCFAIHAACRLELRQTALTFDLLVKESTPVKAIIKELSAEDYNWLDKQFTDAGYRSLAKIFGVGRPS